MYTHVECNTGYVLVHVIVLDVHYHLLSCILSVWSIHINIFILSTSFFLSPMTKGWGIHLLQMNTNVYVIDTWCAFVTFVDC